MVGDHKSEKHKEKERIAKEKALAKASKLKEANDKMKATSKQFKEKEKRIQINDKGTERRASGLEEICEQTPEFRGWEKIHWHQE